MFALVLLVVGIVCAFVFTGNDDDDSSSPPPPTTSSDVKFTVPYKDALSVRGPLNRVVQAVNPDNDDLFTLKDSFDTISINFKIDTT